jgi:hypothetical protein
VKGYQQTQKAIRGCKLLSPTAEAGQTHDTTGTLEKLLDFILNQSYASDWKDTDLFSLEPVTPQTDKPPAPRQTSFAGSEPTVSAAVAAACASAVVVTLAVLACIPWRWLFGLGFAMLLAVVYSALCLWCMVEGQLPDEEGASRVSLGRCYCCGLRDFANRPGPV